MTKYELLHESIIEADMNIETAYYIAGYIDKCFEKGEINSQEHDKLRDLLPLKDADYEKINY